MTAVVISWNTECFIFYDIFLINSLNGRLTYFTKIQYDIKDESKHKYTNIYVYILNKQK